MGWRESLAIIWHRKTLVMLCLGFSAGVPILLIFSSLSLWLREAGVERATVTFFSWAALGYSFKFVWAPLVDRLPLPWLSALLGRRRSWLLLSQLLVMAAIAGMAQVDPAASAHALWLMACFAVMLGFSSATQDIVIDAYRIESADVGLQAVMASSYIAGYRLGMIVAGAGALFLAAYWGSTAQSYSYEAWRWTYWCMVGAMGVGVATTLSITEPEVAVQEPQSSRHHVRLLLVFALTVIAFVGVFYTSGGLLGEWTQGWGALGQLLGAALRLGLSLGAAYVVGRLAVGAGLVPVAVAKTTWVAPIADFFERYGARTAWLILALIGLYRISDIVLGVISNVFYQDMGFTKPEIAAAVKTFGVVVSIAGGFLGGILANRFGVMRSLMWGGILSATTNVMFVVLAHVGHDLNWLYAVVAADNLAAGLASAAFVAFLSSLTHVSFTAVQYAIFSSLMTLLPKTLGGYSGGMVDALGYPGFFVLTALMGLPVLWLVWLAGRRLTVRA
jgi:MFS transporter, PAT family, beta-lactamase induction signal transducer AmpG